MDTNTKRRLAAIMFTDIVGWTITMTKDETKAIELVKNQELLLTPIIDKYNGKIIKRTGDGYLLEYSSSVEAVECAIDIQEAIKNYNSDKDNLEFHIRIGIHLGDTIFENGDIRSGYYRDQTFMMAIDQLTSNQFFSQLYSHTDVKKDPHSAGRQMNCHFATRMLNDSGEWKTLTDIKNSTSDISCVAGQMPRLIGLAYASKLYRNNSSLSNEQNFSINGNEVAFGTIGDAGTSEGHFWEAMNAAGVLQIPLVMSIWDDGYGISVPSEYHTTRNDLSKVLSGFQRSNKNEKGFELFQVKGWDYVGLIKTYRKAILYARNEHVPCIIHVKDVTQPQGHTTSGSHERYKSKERLKWEDDFCCIKKMKEWIIKNKIADLNELNDIEISAASSSKKSRNSAWKSYKKDINEDLQDANAIITRVAQNSPKNKKEIISVRNDLNNIIQPLKSDIQKSLKYVQRIIRSENNIAKHYLINLISEKSNLIRELFLPKYD